RVLRPHDGRRAEGDRAADGSAEVLRILNAVEDEAEEIGRREDGFGRDELELGREGRDSLVVDPAGHAIELPARHSADVSRALVGCKTGHGVQTTLLASAA